MRRPGPTSANDAEAGFTLVEALAALLLLSVTLALFGAAFRLEGHVGEAGRARERLFASGAGLDAISNLLTRAMPIVDPTDEQQSKIIFNGQPHRISFVTLSEGTVHPGGLLAASISYRTNNIGAGDIRVETETMRLGETRLAPSKGTGSTPLLANVRSARFRYYGSKLAGRPAQWYDNWTDEMLLPRLVMLNVTVQLRRDSQALEFVYWISAG
jgi:type II secretory pathway pseudopilin PulG